MAAPLLPSPRYDLEPADIGESGAIDSAVRNDSTDSANPDDTIEAGEITKPRLPVVPLPLPGTSALASNGRERGKAKRRPGLNVLVPVVLLVALIAGAAGFYAFGRSSSIYQSSLHGSQSGWENSQDCAAKADGYHIASGSICYVPIGTQTNVSVKVTVEQLSGSSELFYGIALRSMPRGHYYLFAIDGYGKWSFVEVPGLNQAPINVIAPALDSAVRSGLHQTNTLQVKMKGSHFQFFINGSQVGDVIDSHFASGQIGLSGEAGVTVVYTDLSIVNAQ